MSLISTVGGVQREIAYRLNEVSADNADRYLNWINLGLEDLAAEFPTAPWLETSAVLTLAANTLRWQVSSIATDVRHIKNVRISTQNVRVRYVPKDTFDALDPQPSDSGIPSVFTIYNNEISFYPQPNSDYGAQIDYFQNAVTVSAASAVPELPARYIESLVHFAHIQGLRRREDWQESQLVEQIYMNYKNRIKKELLRKNQGPIRMISQREIQDVNQYYGDEITQTIFNR